MTKKQEKERLQAALDYANQKAIEEDAARRADMRFELNWKKNWAIWDGITASWGEKKCD